MGRADQVFYVRVVVEKDKDNIGFSLRQCGRGQGGDETAGCEDRFQYFQVHALILLLEKLKKQAGARTSKSPRRRLFSGNSLC